MTNLPDIPKLAATSNILITKAVRPASNWYPQTLPMQLARSRHPFNTRKVPLNAASFLTWHGSWISVVKDPNVNTTYTGLLHKYQPSAEHHPCYSGLQVQGTATTPAARIIILHDKWMLVKYAALSFAQDFTWFYTSVLQTLCFCFFPHLPGFPEFSEKLLHQLAAFFFQYTCCKICLMVKRLDIQ